MRNKKMIQRFIAFIIVGTTMLMGFSSCKPNADSSTDKNNEMIETSEFIVKDGKTDYKIVMDSNPSSDEEFAKSELLDIFSQATGITLPVVLDTEELSYEGKYLSIGDNELLKSTKETVSSKEFGSDGFRLFTKGNTVFMCGGEEEGTLYAVYEFLNRAFDFEVYGTNGTHLNTEVKDLKLYLYNIKQIPSFEKRSVGSGLVYESAATQRRLRLESTGVFLGSVNGVQVHNSLAYLPPNDYYEQHPDWFTGSRGELCYTAHGNQTEYELMTQQATNVIKETIIETDAYMLTLTQQDNTVFCNCSECVRLEGIYGCKSAAIIQFTNSVHRKVKAWMASEEGKAYDRNFRLFFFAYQESLDAPVKEENGELKPIDGNVVCDKGVGVYFAPMELDYTRSIYDEVNQNFLAAFGEWKVLTDDMIMWSYATNFNYYLAAYDCFEYMQEFFRLAKETGVQTMYHQQQNNQLGGSTGWHNLKIYLSAKLMWNVDANVGELTENFFDCYYGIASEEMMQLYTEYRVHSAVTRYGKEGKPSSIYANPLKPELWQRELVIGWRKDIADIVRKIEPLKEQDSTEYARIYKNVVSEGVAIDYILLEVYGNTFDQTQLSDLKAEFRNYLTVSGITKLDLLTQITSYLETLGN